MTLWEGFRMDEFTRERENFYSLISGAYPELAIPILRDRPEFANGVCGKLLVFIVNFWLNGERQSKKFTADELPCVLIPTHKRHDFIQLIGYYLVVYPAYDPHEWMLVNIPEYKKLYEMSDPGSWLPLYINSIQGYIAKPKLGGYSAFNVSMHHKRVAGDPPTWIRTGQRARFEDQFLEDYDPTEYYPVFEEEVRRFVNSK